MWARDAVRVSIGKGWMLGCEKEKVVENVDESRKRGKRRGRDG